MNIEILSSDEFKKINEKKEDQSYSSGCLMGYFDKPFKEININEEDLYDNEENEYGKELATENHVTLLYGLTDSEIDENEIIRLFTLIDGPIVTSNKISLFENEKFDVVKFEIESEDLNILNKVLTSTFPFKSDYPDYKAHSTVCYCLPSKGSNYIEEFETPLENKIAYWVYSKADGRKIKIVPNGEMEVLRESNKLTNNESNYLVVTQHATNYKGYDIKLESTKYVDQYKCSIYINEQYVMALKQNVSYNEGIKISKNYIDNL